MSPRSTVRASLVAGVLLAAGAPASAYNVAKSSSGASLHWADGPVTFTLAFDPLPSNIDPAVARTIAMKSAATWQAALAGDAVTVGIADGAVASAPHAVDGVNSVRWPIDATDPDLEAGLLGRTFVAYKVSTGELTDADVVLDGVDYTWTTDVSNCGDEYDVESALTHELGHGLGLAHSVGHPDATMFATGDACETTKRTLATDDLRGLANLYAPPPDVAPPAMADGGGCSAAGGGAGGGAGLFVIAAAVVATRRRRAAGIAIAAIAAVGTIAPGSASAAQLRRLEMTDLAADAAMVVRGHVVATTVVRDPAIETESEVVVDECLAGACPARLQVRRHGGELGDDGLWVDGEAQVGVGEEVVLFVRVDRHAHVRVLGGVQGAWRVERAAGGAAPRLVRDLRGHELASAAGWVDGEREVVGLDTLRRTLASRSR